jgi:hypothetical protein
VLHVRVLCVHDGLSPGMKTAAIRVLLAHLEPDPDRSLGATKTVFVQCACGLWQVQFHFGDSMLHGTETFQTKDAAVREIVERIVDEGIPMGQLQ